MEHTEADLAEKAAHILYPIFVGQFFGIILTALTFIVVARLLDPVGYGLYVFAFGFSALVNGFSGFGVGSYLSSTIAKFVYNREGENVLRAVWTGYIIAGIIGLILTFIGISLSPWVAAKFPAVNIDPQLLMLTSATIVFFLINTVSVSALIGFSRTGLGAITNVLVDLVQLSLSFFLTIDFGVKGAIVAMLVGYMFGAVLGTFFVYMATSKHVRFRIAIPSRAHIWSIFLYVTPVAWTNFLNSGMQNFSILLLGLFVTNIAVIGNYGAAMKGLALLTMIYTALGSGLFPIFTTAKAINTGGNVNTVYNKIIKFAIMLMLPIIIFVAVMAGPGMGLLVGPAFYNASYYLTLIAIGTCVALFGGYVNNLVISEGYTAVTFKVNLVSAILQFILLVILVPRYQVVGAILAVFFFGDIIEAYLFTIYAKKLFGIKFEYGKLVLLYASGIALAIILAALLNFMSNVIVTQNLYSKYAIELAMGFLFTLLVYPIILVAMKAINWHDIKSMRHATLRMGATSFLFAGFFNYSEFLYRTLIGM